MIGVPAHRFVERDVLVPLRCGIEHTLGVDNVGEQRVAELRFVLGKLRQHETTVRATRIDPTDEPADVRQEDFDRGHWIEVTCIRRHILPVLPISKQPLKLRVGNERFAAEGVPSVNVGCSLLPPFSLVICSALVMYLT